MIHPALDRYLLPVVGVWIIGCFIARFVIHFTRPRGRFRRNGLSDEAIESVMWPIMLIAWILDLVTERRSK